MVMQVEVKKNSEQAPEVSMKAQVTFGRKAPNELRVLVRNRPDKLVINGKQYLEFCSGPGRRRGSIRMAKGNSLAMSLQKKPTSRIYFKETQ